MDGQSRSTVYQGKKLGDYRDFALSVVGGICLLLGVALATESPSSPFHSAIDWKIEIGCLAVAALCVIVSPRRFRVLAGCFAATAGLLSQLFSTHFDWRVFEARVAMIALALSVGIAAGLTTYFRGR